MKTTDLCLRGRLCPEREAGAVKEAEKTAAVEIDEEMMSHEEVGPQDGLLDRSQEEAVTG